MSPRALLALGTAQNVGIQLRQHERVEKNDGLPYRQARD